MDLKFIQLSKSSLSFTFQMFSVLLVTFILICLLFITTIIILLIFLPLQTAVALLARKYRPDLESVVKSMHTFFALRSDGISTSNIMCIITLDGSYSVEFLRKLFHERVMNVKDGDEFLYDKLWKTWDTFLGYEFWKIDLNFNVNNHIRDYDYPKELVLPNLCSEADVEKLAGKLINAPWDPRRSPWEFLRIANFEPNNPSEKHEKVVELVFKTGLIFRIDHMLGDGYSLMQFLRVYLNTEIKFPAFNLDDNSSFPSWRKAGMHLMSPYCAARDLLPVISATNLQFGRKLDIRDTTIVFSPTVDVATVKIIKNHFKVHYASVMYAAIFGAIYRACELSGQKIPRDVASMFALPSPNHPKGMALHAGVQMATWPLKSNSRMERLQMIQRTLSRSSSGMLYFSLMGSLASCTPVFIRKFAQEMGKNSGTGISIAFSLFPVALNKLQFEGKPIDDMKILASMNTPGGLVVMCGGISNLQRVIFIAPKGIFASEEETRKLGGYFMEELHHLLEETR